MKGRLIGLDHGAKRIGLAVSDALGIAARELTILKSRGRAQDYEQILAIAERERAVGFVVGMPYSPNAPPGMPLQADVVKEWIAGLRKATDLPIAEVSEYLTSDEARELSRKLKRKSGEPIDDLAARVILQSYLDSHI